jgi:signal transduction histidine kinase
MKPEVAHRRIEAFGKRFGEAHLYLAYHAAFPLALTPDLFYRLWANFQRDIHGEVLNIPWIAVADLLLSSLCDEVGHELYEMEKEVRNALLSELKANPRFGTERINELSDFLLAYVRQQLDSPDIDTRDFAQAQKWTALAYSRPSEAASEIATALSKLKLEDRAEWIRMTSLVETFAEPLAEFEPLLIYTRGMADFTRGNFEGAAAQLNRVLNQEGQIQVAGVLLPVPEQIETIQHEPLVNDSKEMLDLALQNITPAKQSEAELRKALEIERELSELKSSFITITSHEFRTPLTTIQSSAELLEHYSERLSDEKKQMHLKRIQRSVSHLAQLLDDVLIIGTAEAGKLQFEPSPMNLVAFCGDIVESIRMSVHPHPEIAFVTRCDRTDAQMDEKLLGHIITNLLSNAIKYSPKAGTVRFELACTDSSATFCIQDSGIGIPQEDIDKLFESFQRASNVGTIPGTGLGLAVVKRCVDLHGGEITVESEVGVGTTFIVTLPLNC